jgi:hypothetical protein
VSLADQTAVAVKTAELNNRTRHGRLGGEGDGEIKLSLYMTRLETVLVTAYLRTNGDATHSNTRRLGIGETSSCF